MSGTNGKGSVAVLVAASLEAAGWRVGLYTSPHLVSVRERVCVNGVPIGERAFAMWTARLRDTIETTGASFFEATTAIAFADFAARGVEIAVVEVGLGGRLDCTNVITPLVTAVTTVAREHEDYLGRGTERIAREKAGIAKAGVPFVVGEPDPSIRAVLATEAAARGAPVVFVDGDAATAAIGMMGPHQQRNAQLATAILGHLPVPYRPGSEAVNTGLSRGRLPGRFDRRGRWLFDVAHNPQACQALVAALHAARPPRPLHLVVGILGDKAWQEMLATLLPAVDRSWATDTPDAPHERRWSLDDVAGWAGGRALTVTADLGQALTEAARGAGTVLVTGSFYTVGAALRRLPGFSPIG